MNVSGGVKAVRLGMLAALFASIPAEGAGPHPVRAQLVADVATVNGSVSAIAGITNAARNVFGMMPHPERSAEALVGGPAHGGANTDGRKLLEGLIHTIGGAA